MTKHSPHTNAQGFTIIETLLAVLLLSVTLSVAVMIVVRQVDVSLYTQQSFVASKIAMQGIELMRIKRDNNVLCLDSGECTAISDWFEGLVGTWEPDVTNQDASHPGNSYDAFAGTASTICVSRANGTMWGRYTNCAGGSGTPGADQEALRGGFTRVVEVSTIPGSDYSVEVKSTVRWTGGRQIVIYSVLYNTYI
jgi:type II secretory pathway pseudopilin PulG